MLRETVGEEFRHLPAVEPHGNLMLKRAPPRDVQEENLDNNDGDDSDFEDDVDENLEMPHYIRRVLNRRRRERRELARRRQVRMGRRRGGNRNAGNEDEIDLNVTQDEDLAD